MHIENFRRWHWALIGLALGLIFLPPVILMGALVIGLGDTWLDLRARARAAA